MLVIYKKVEGKEEGKTVKGSWSYEGSTYGCLQLNSLNLQVNTWKYIILPLRCDIYQIDIWKEEQILIFIAN